MTAREIQQNFNVMLEKVQHVLCVKGVVKFKIPLEVRALVAYAKECGEFSFPLENDYCLNIRELFIQSNRHVKTTNLNKIGNREKRKISLTFCVKNAEARSEGFFIYSRRKIHSLSKGKVERIQRDYESNWLKYYQPSARERKQNRKNRSSLFSVKDEDGFGFDLEYRQPLKLPLQHEFSGSPILHGKHLYSPMGNDVLGSGPGTLLPVPLPTKMINVVGGKVVTGRVKIVSIDPLVVQSGEKITIRFVPEGGVQFSNLAGVFVFVGKMKLKASGIRKVQSESGVSEYVVDVDCPKFQTSLMLLVMVGVSLGNRPVIYSNESRVSYISPLMIPGRPVYIKKCRFMVNPVPHNAPIGLHHIICIDSMMLTFENQPISVFVPSVTNFHCSMNGHKVRLLSIKPSGQNRFSLRVAISKSNFHCTSELKFDHRDLVVSGKVPVRFVPKDSQEWPELFLKEQEDISRYLSLEGNHDLYARFVVKCDVDPTEPNFIDFSNKDCERVIQLCKNDRDVTGADLMMHFALRGLAYLVHLCIKSGYDVANKDLFGNRAMHWAHFSGGIVVASLLKRAGDNEMVGKNRAGRTPMEMASFNELRQMPIIRQPSLKLSAPPPGGSIPSMRRRVKKSLPRANPGSMLVNLPSRILPNAEVVEKVDELDGIQLPGVRSLETPPIPGLPTSMYIPLEGKDRPISVQQGLQPPLPPPVRLPSFPGRLQLREEPDTVMKVLDFLKMYPPHFSSRRVRKHNPTPFHQIGENERFGNLPHYKYTMKMRFNIRNGEGRVSISDAGLANELDDIQLYLCSEDSEIELPNEFADREIPIQNEVAANGKSLLTLVYGLAIPKGACSNRRGGNQNVERGKKLFFFRLKKGQVNIYESPKFLVITKLLENIQPGMVAFFVMDVKLIDEEEERLGGSGQGGGSSGSEHLFSEAFLLKDSIANNTSVYKVAVTVQDPRYGPVPNTNVRRKAFVNVFSKYMGNLFERSKLSIEEDVQQIVKIDFKNEKSVHLTLICTDEVVLNRVLESIKSEVNWMIGPILPMTFTVKRSSAGGEKEMSDAKKRKRK